MEVQTVEQLNENRRAKTDPHQRIGKKPVASLAFIGQFQGQAQQRKRQSLALCPGIVLGSSLAVFIFFCLFASYYQKAKRRGQIMPEILLTVDEAAERLKIKPATLRSQLRAGRVASVRIGKMWRIPESALEPTPTRRDAAPVYAKANAPSVLDAPTQSELDALFAPATSEEIARRLDALDRLTSAPKADAPETDLSGDRGEVYGYTERENRQR